MLMSILAAAFWTSSASAQAAQGGGAFTGVVVSDSTRAPIAGAEVAVTDLTRSAMADAKGAFRIDSIPPGVHRIRVRAIGYGAADTLLVFKENETIQRRVVLGRAVSLEAISVEATRPLIPSFAENRKRGLGHFLTRADLAAREDMSLMSFLEQMNGLRVVHGSGSHAWIRSAHGGGSIHGIPAEFADSSQGAPLSACWSKVYLNDLLVFSGRLIEDRGRLPGQKSVHWEPLFDVAAFSAYQVEAVEYYASPAETPLQYQRDATCGVLVIWTRRSP
jgi:hypothetical protein